MRKLVAILFGLLVATHAALANDNAKLVGIWKLMSLDVEFQSGDPSRPLLGQRWMGYTIFTPEGRTMSIWEAEDRKSPSTDAERAALFRSLNAISGTYHYDGGTGVVDIDIAGNPAGRGKQTRGYKLDGNRLEITTPWAPSATIAGSPMTRTLVRLERVAK